jgi:HNH endonuclease
MASVVRQPCSFAECGRPAVARGLCSGHYKQLNSGRELAPLRRQVAGRSRSVEERLWSRRVVDSSGCWLWTGSLTSNGYGQIQVDGVIWLVHRLSHAIYSADPGCETVHHVCAVRRCFNPAHLQLISVRENIAEMRERQAYRQEIARLGVLVRQLEAELNLYRASDMTGEGAAVGLTERSGGPRDKATHS